MSPSDNERRYTEDEFALVLRLASYGASVTPGEGDTTLQAWTDRTETMMRLLEAMSTEAEEAVDRSKALEDGDVQSEEPEE
jgi:hypothetical protein